MHPDDLKLLAAAPASASPSEAIADALGVGCPALRTLSAAIWDDLDEASKGIGWWSGYPLDDQRRILISDQLSMAAKYTEQNLTEARVHLSEMKEACAEEDRTLAHSVQLDENGGLVVNMPERKSAAEQLAAFNADLHMVGVFQALGSAFDCLAAVAIGVLAIPDNLLRADLGKLRQRLAAPALLAEAAGIRQSAADALNRLADDPIDGWLEWALAYRNTLVHRPRPISSHRLEPTPSLHAASGGQHLLTRDIRVLAAHPGLSDIEVMAQPLAPVLEEEGLLTLNGAIAAASRLVDEMSGELFDVWTTRRATPALLEQPANQWKLPLPAGNTFAGFLAGSLPYDPDQITAHPSMARRMLAAGVLDHDRPNYW